MEMRKFLKTTSDATSKRFFLAYLKQKNIFARGEAILKHTEICLKFECLDLEWDFILLIFNSALNNLHKKHVEGLTLEGGILSCKVNGKLEY